MTEARALRCDGCGGPVPLRDLTAASAACPSCGRTVIIPEPLRRELAAHGASAVASLAAARAEAASGAALSADHAARQRLSTPALILSLVVMGGGMLVLAVAGGERSPLLWLGPIGINGAILAIAWYVHNARGRAALAPVASPVTPPLHCPGCGAPQAFLAGDPTARCRRCGTFLFPTPPVLAAAAAAAQEVLLRERAARHRAERAGWPTHRPKSSTFLGILVPGALILAIALAVVPLALQRGSLELPLQLGAVGALFFFGGIYVWRVEDRRERALAHGAATLLTALRGQEIAQPIAWLNAWWAGPAPMELAFGGKHFRALAFQPLGYQLLLVLNPVPVKHQQPGIFLLLAASIPGVSDRIQPDPALLASWRRAPAAIPLLAALGDAGFQIELDAAGLFCSATRPAAARLARMPEEAVLLSAAVEDLARLAAAIGARPLPKALPA